MELVRAAMGLPRDGYRTDERLIEVTFGDWERLYLCRAEGAAPGGEPIDDASGQMGLHAAR